MFPSLVRVYGISGISRATHSFRAEGILEAPSGAIEKTCRYSKSVSRPDRPVRPITKQPPPPPDAPLQSSPFYKDAFGFFRNYPERSLMSDESRAVLFTLIRSRGPTYIAEIGTLHAGTTDVMARAC